MITGSEASTIQSPDSLRVVTTKGKGVEQSNKAEGGLAQRSLQRKVKSSRQLVNKLCQNHLGSTSNNSVLLKGPQDQRRVSVQGLVHYKQKISSVDDSSSSSTTTDSSSKGSNAAGESTRKTSLDSRFTVLPTDLLKRRNSRRHPWTRSSPEGGALGTIEEAAIDQTRPSILTVERAAAAKVYIETTFQEKMNKPDPRDTRRQLLESQLYFSPHVDMDQKDAVRRSYHAQETCHLREVRVLKAQSQAAGRGRAGGPYVDNYETLKVLGKGSFGVVRLVREKSRADHSHGHGQAHRQQVYAMKVIRKSDMLRSSQEGHLRAERDFLVASEGSQ